MGLSAAGSVLGVVGYVSVSVCEWGGGAGSGEGRRQLCRQKHTEYKQNVVQV